MIQTVHKKDILFSQFIQKINTCFDELTEDEILILRDAVQIKTVPKNEIIFSEGNIANKIYFILEGCVRLYVNVGGQDRTTFFYGDGEFLWAGKSYIYKIPAKENYQALEETTLAIFDQEVTDYLLSNFPKFEHIVRLAAEDELMKCQQLITSFVSLTAEERYVELMRTNANLFQRVPQKYIASYLGVSAETLSRIKKRVILKIREERLKKYHALAS